MTKKQIGFYADPDVEAYLETLDSGIKTRAINASIRAFMESRRSMEPPAYQDELESLVAWLEHQTDQVIVLTRTGQGVSLAGLMRKFLHQDRLRNPSMNWTSVAQSGITFPTPEHPAVNRQSDFPPTPPNRCASCQKPLTNPVDAIVTPTRGRICRSCFELPFTK